MRNVDRPVLVVLCHLGWNGVWQRPQQVLSRLSRDFDVIFHEEPVSDSAADSGPFYERFSPHAHIEVLKPHLPPQPEYGYNAGNWDTLGCMLQEVLASEPYRDRPVAAWCYTPMAYPIAASLEPAVLAYDCMDELSLFRFAPLHMKELEQELMRNADVVFCGGASMYRNRKDRHPNVHLLLSGVDCAHFEQAKDAAMDEPDQLSEIPHPRIGYWGVLDERIDWDLLARSAQARPDWHWVLVGPFAKVNPDELPKAPNLHYMGPAAYNDLPRYARGFDVAMMPFAMNEATRFISPTKTLEYMAASIPVVSTPVADVVDPYAGPVWIANNTDEFILAIECMLGESSESRARRLEAYQTWVNRWSWDKIAGIMRVELLRGLQQRSQMRNKNELSNIRLPEFALSPARTSGLAIPPTPLKQR